MTMTSEPNLTVKFQSQSDESGIFMSMLYLIGEAQKRGLKFTAAKLIAAAQGLITECEGHGPLSHDLTAALEFYLHCMGSSDARTMEIVRALDKMDG